MRKKNKKVKSVEELMFENELSKGYKLIVLENREPEYCTNCGKEIHVQSFKGTGLCSIRCQKEVQGDPAPMQTLHSRLANYLDNLQKLYDTKPEIETNVYGHVTSIIDSMKRDLL